MAGITAIDLRDSARAALLGAGGRGFVRFCEQGALLVSDAIRRCEDDAARQKLTDALAQAGFESWTQDDLLMIVPSLSTRETIRLSCWPGATTREKDRSLL